MWLTVFKLHQLYSELNENILSLFLECSLLETHHVRQRDLAAPGAWEVNLSDITPFAGSGPMET